MHDERYHDTSDSLNFIKTLLEGGPDCCKHLDIEIVWKENERCTACGHKNRITMANWVRLKNRHPDYYYFVLIHELAHMILYHLGHRERHTRYFKEIERAMLATIGVKVEYGQAYAVCYRHIDTNKLICDGIGVILTNGKHIYPKDFAIGECVEVNYPADGVNKSRVHWLGIVTRRNTYSVSMRGLDDPDTMLMCPPGYLTKVTSCFTPKENGQHKTNHETGK